MLMREYADWNNEITLFCKGSLNAVKELNCSVGDWMLGL